MGCPPVREDNPPAKASGSVSYVQVDKHGITIYTTYINIELTHHEIVHVKVGKNGISKEKSHEFAHLLKSNKSL